MVVGDVDVVGVVVTVNFWGACTILGRFDSVVRRGLEVLLLANYSGTREHYLACQNPYRVRVALNTRRVFGTRVPGYATVQGHPVPDRSRRNHGG